MTEENIDGYVDGDDFVITRDCPRCTTRQEIRARTEDFVAWRSKRKLIQQAFPYLSAAQREILQTGICNKCWETLYGEEAEDEYQKG